MQHAEGSWRENGDLCQQIAFEALSGLKAGFGMMSRNCVALYQNRVVDLVSNKGH